MFWSLNQFIPGRGNGINKEHVLSDVNKHNWTPFISLQFEGERREIVILQYLFSVRISEPSSFLIHGLIKFLIQIPHTSFIVVTVFLNLHSWSHSHTQFHMNSLSFTKQSKLYLSLSLLKTIKSTQESPASTKIPNLKKQNQYDFFKEENWNTSLKIHSLLEIHPKSNKELKLTTKL